MTIHFMSSPVVQCVECELLYAAIRMVAGSHPCSYSVRMTYRPSAALRMLGSLRISKNKFLQANKRILLLPYVTETLHIIYVFSAYPINSKWGEKLCFCAVPVTTDYLSHHLISMGTLLACWGDLLKSKTASKMIDKMLQNIWNI